MNTMKKSVLGLCALAACLGATGSFAQSTDGYHSIQVFPLVVETASFAQRFHFHNPNNLALTLTPRYYPSEGTSQAPNSLVCPNLVIPANKTLMVPSLRTLCPGLPSTGSQFGFVYTSELSAENLPYSAFSRVFNPLGNGFTVESFPAHTFTSATSFLTGLRRLTATASTPAFQTNCFVANLNEVTASGASSSVGYTLYNSSDAVIATGALSLAPGKHVRMLDVFSTAGLVTGDYNDASIRFEELNPSEEPALMSFCTVQDNTSFGADFRIAKQEVGAGGLSFPGDVTGSQDNHVARETRVSADGLGRNFEVGAGSSSNTHVIYFRHPDYVQCEILDPSNARMTSAAGLEMRMLDQNGLVLAGGNGSTGFGKIYMGDKADRNDGSNTRYTIEVESNEQNATLARPYKLHCQSGSGHSLGDLIRYKEGADRF